MTVDPCNDCTKTAYDCMACPHKPADFVEPCPRDRHVPLHCYCGNCDEASFCLRCGYGVRHAAPSNE